MQDLPIGGRPVVICWHKRVWCCPHALCPVKTWTEVHPAIAPRACLTERARARACEQVGRCDAAVSRVARELGVANKPSTPSIGVPVACASANNASITNGSRGTIATSGERSAVPIGSVGTAPYNAEPWPPRAGTAAKALFVAPDNR